MMKRLVFLALIMVMAGLMVVPSMALATAPVPNPTTDNPGTPSNNGVTAVVWDRNPDCSDVQTQCIDSKKLEPVVDGTYTVTGDNGFEVTITTDGTYFSFEGATKWISYIIVKAGNTSNVYYNNGQPSDGNLHGPVDKVNPDGSYSYHALSHIEFCYDGQTPPLPELSTIVLMSLGILGLGAFVFLRRRNAHASAVA